MQIFLHNSSEVFFHIKPLFYATHIPDKCDSSLVNRILRNSLVSAELYDPRGNICPVVRPLLDHPLAGEEYAKDAKSRTHTRGGIYISMQNTESLLAATKLGTSLFCLLSSGEALCHSCFMLQAARCARHETIMLRKKVSRASPCVPRVSRSLARDGESIAPLQPPTLFAMLSIFALQIYSLLPKYKVSGTMLHLLKHMPREAARKTLS